MGIHLQISLSAIYAPIITEKKMLELYLDDINYLRKYKCSFHFQAFIVDVRSDACPHDSKLLHENCLPLTTRKGSCEMET